MPKKPLLTDRRYVSFDLETTWLDIKRDEPIQIWLIVYDQYWTITDSRSSYIRPQKDIKELKSIVQHVTWLDLEQLQTAPTLTELLPEISQWFKPWDVYVGQNISFDIAMLEKYLTIPDHTVVDTYVLARTLFPFLTTYSLGWIYEWWVTSQWRTPINSSQSAHDALYDSFMAHRVLLEAVTQFDQLRRKYLIIDSMIQRSEWMLAHIINRSHKTFAYEEKELFLPALPIRKYVAKRLLSDHQVTLPTWSDQLVDCSQLPMEQLLSSIPRHEKPRIISCSHPNKAKLIQQSLDTLWIYSQRLYTPRQFDDHRVNTFLHRASFTDEEILFITKYFLHFTRNDTRLDIQSPTERILHTILTNPVPLKSAPWTIYVTTHDTMLKHRDLITNHHLLYFDQDRWMGSAINTLYPSFNRYDLQHALERAILYGELTDQEDAELTEIYEQLPFAIAISDSLATHAFQHASGWSRSVSVIDLFWTSTISPEQAWLPLRLLESLATSTNVRIESEHGQHIQSLAQRAFDLFTWEVTIQQAMYHGDKRYYRFQHAERFVEYAELIHELPPLYTLFTTNPKKSGVKLQVWSLPPRKAPRIVQVQDEASVMNNVQQWWTFVLCGQKQRARTLREYLHSKWITHVYAENITWWVGKTLHTLWSLNEPMSSQKWPVIVIWSLNFYLAMLTQKFVFSTICSYHMYGHTKALAFNDIAWYSMSI